MAMVDKRYLGDDGTAYILPVDSIIAASSDLLDLQGDEIGLPSNLSPRYATFVGNIGPLRPYVAIPFYQASDFPLAPGTSIYIGTTAYYLSSTQAETIGGNPFAGLVGPQGPPGPPGPGGGTNAVTEFFPDFTETILSDDWHFLRNGVTLPAGQWLTCDIALHITNSPTFIACQLGTGDDTNYTSLGDDVLLYSAPIAKTLLTARLKHFNSSPDAMTIGLLVIASEDSPIANGGAFSVVNTVPRITFTVGDVDYSAP